MLSSNIMISVILTICLSTVLANTCPPKISIQPAREIYFKVGEAVQIPCVANGEPQPTYSWKKNNVLYNVGMEYRFNQLPNVGTIVIPRPEERDEGVYQCIAHNGYGVSASIKVNLRLAKLDHFAHRPRLSYKPFLGSSLTLPCVSPNSVPAADIFWTKKEEFGGLVPIDYDARVTMDHENRLRITSIRRDDDGEYACMAMNMVARDVKQSSSIRIASRGEIAQLNPVRYMWASPTDNFGLYGEEFKMKCIFSGNPTPDVHWAKINGNLSNSAKIGSFGQELQFDSLEFSDAGQYECRGNNTLGTVYRSLMVRVESRPYWIVEPKDVEVVNGGTARFTCKGDGHPQPQRYWYINNVNFQDVTDPRLDGRFHALNGGETVELVNVTMADTMVIQCNVTNKHGYIFSDVYLNVLSEAPIIIGK